MKRRILALLLSLAMVTSLFTIFASAVPYSPSANAWKDFGQNHYYFYEVNAGKAAPKMDGKITESDGYGEPIGTYSIRYTTTVQKVVEISTGVPRPEYKLRKDGTYYVYPTPDSPQEVWNSIESTETDLPFGHIWTVIVPETSYVAGGTYYYIDPDTKKFNRAYNVTAKTTTNYTVLDSAGNMVLRNVELTTEKPADWEKNYTNYFVPAATNYKPVTGDTAPEWKPGLYWKGERIVVPRLYMNTSGTPGSVASASWLAMHHVVLPEKINLYARYDEKYFYYAVELVEAEHQNARYGMDLYFSTNMSNSPGVLSSVYDFAYTFRQELNSDIPTISLISNIYIYTTALHSFKNTKYPFVIAKYGDPNATTIAATNKVGEDFAIGHSSYTPPSVNTEERDPFAEDPEVLTSGTYGVTTYETRQIWSVINAKYSPNESASAVPESFALRCQIQLENTCGPASGYYLLSFTIPRCSDFIPGSSSRPAGGNYPKNLHTMRFPDRTGLTQGEDFGTFKFAWNNISGARSLWSAEAFTTDYVAATSWKTYLPTFFPPIFFPAGREPNVAAGYVQPSVTGAQLRVDGEDGQKIRVKLSVPDTEKAISEVGVIVAPTEVARRQQLRLGMKQIAYIAEERSVYYGVVNGEWINLVEHYWDYFGDSTTPGDHDSYLTYDTVGGKPSGLYTVYTLPVEDLNAPYSRNTKQGEEANVYTVVFAGPNGEGLFNDFDDYFTFYTFRPYVIYEDGTVVYGEQEYKSLYYLACWTIQEIITSYNNTVVGSDSIADKYNMDQMYLTTAKDKSGTTLKDADGNTIYLPVANTTAANSPYSGGAENSIYWPERRAEVFRWYAVRLLSRQNKNAPLRPADYEKFHEDVKVLVGEYEQMLENIWNVVVTAESNRYVAPLPTADK